MKLYTQLIILIVLRRLFTSKRTEPFFPRRVPKKKEKTSGAGCNTWIPPPVRASHTSVLRKKKVTRAFEGSLDLSVHLCPDVATELSLPTQCFLCFFFTLLFRLSIFLKNIVENNVGLDRIAKTFICFSIDTSSRHTFEKRVQIVPLKEFQIQFYDDRHFAPEGFLHALFFTRQKRKNSSTGVSSNLVKKKYIYNISKSTAEATCIWETQIIPKHYPIPFSTFVRDK